MPVQADGPERRQVSIFERAAKGYAEHNQQRKQTHADVKPMEACEREECRGEKIQTDCHTSPI